MRKQGMPSCTRCKYLKCNIIIAAVVAASPMLISFHAIFSWQLKTTKHFNDDDKLKNGCVYKPISTKIRCNSVARTLSASFGFPTNRIQDPSNFVMERIVNKRVELLRRLWLELATNRQSNESGHKQHTRVGDFLPTLKHSTKCTCPIGHTMEHRSPETVHR